MEDDVRVCRACGKLYKNYGTRGNICAACFEKEEKQFLDAKKYINDNDTTNIQEVSEELEIPIKTLQKWIREERLMFHDRNGFTKCEKCGAEIPTGRYCPTCKRKMLNVISTAMSEPESNGLGYDTRTSRMRYKRED